MKITAINLQKLKSNVYRKRINVLALKQPALTQNKAPSKPSIGNSKKTTGLGKVTTGKPVIASNKLNTRNGGKPVGKPVAPSTKMDVVKPAFKPKPLGSTMKPLVASPGKLRSKPNLAPSSLGIKSAVKPGLTKPGSLDRSRTGIGAAKLSIQMSADNGTSASAIKKPANTAMFGSKIQDNRESAGASVNVEKISAGTLKDISFITSKLVWQGVRKPSAVLAKVQKQGGAPDLDNQPEPGNIKEPGKADLRYVEPKTPFLKKSDKLAMANELQDERGSAADIVSVEKISEGSHSLKDITFVTSKLVWQGVREPSAVLAKVQKQGVAPDLDNQPEPGNIKEPGRADLRYVEPKTPFLKKSDKLAMANELQDERGTAADIVSVEEISEGSLKDITFITNKLVWQGVRETPAGEDALQQVNPQQGQSLSNVDNAPVRRGFDVR